MTQGFDQNSANEQNNSNEGGRGGPFLQAWNASPNLGGTAAVYNAFMREWNRTHPNDQQYNFRNEIPQEPGSGGSQVGNSVAALQAGGSNPAYWGPGGQGILPSPQTVTHTHDISQPNGKFRIASDDAYKPDWGDMAPGTSEHDDSYAAFKAKFQEVAGRPITDAEQNDNAFVQQLSNALFTLLPLARQASFSGARLSQLDNPSLKKVIDANTQVLGSLSADRLVGKGAYAGGGFSREDVQGFITELDRINPKGQLGKDLSTAMGIAPSEGESKGTGKGPANSDQKGYIHDPKNPDPNSPWIPGPGVTPTGTGEPSKGPSGTNIPPELSWVYDVGAADWARAKLDAKVDPKLITRDMLHNDMAAQWQMRQTDPKFKDIYVWAQRYYAATAHWPTDVEFNRYTADRTDIPAILPDGSGLLPKPSAGTGKAGELPKWEVPKTPLPPGYEWRFSSDGTPTQYDITPDTKDVFSGWFQDPKTGTWTYDPIAGAADYLSYNKASQGQWGDILNSFVNRTGRLPSLDEAHNLASQLWASADAATRDRATRYADMYGVYPTPYELEYGPAKDTNASTGGGKQNAAGLGQVPVFVPGIGTVLVQGESMGKGGFAFDPFQGIPDTVRPWVREILNGRLTADQVPPEMKDWVNFATQKFQEQLPRRRPEDIPWGVTGPNGHVPTIVPAIDKVVGTAAFSLAYKQLNPNLPEPTTAQMNDVGWLSQQDVGLTKFLDGVTLKRFPMEALIKLDNQTLLDKVGMDTISKLPPERLLGIGNYKGQGFGADVIAGVPADKFKMITPDLIPSGYKQLSNVPQTPVAATTTPATTTPATTTPATTTTTPTTPALLPPGPAQKDVLQNAFNTGGILGYSKALQLVVPAATTTTPTTPALLPPGPAQKSFLQNVGAAVTLLSPHDRAYAPGPGEVNPQPFAQEEGGYPPIPKQTGGGAAPALLRPQDVYTQTTPDEYANESTKAGLATDWQRGPTGGNFGLPTRPLT